MASVFLIATSCSTMGERILLAKFAYPTKELCEKAIEKLKEDNERLFLQAKQDYPRARRSKTEFWPKEFFLLHETENIHA
jgi:hypothetical protein